jgi:hypothetical protein
MCLDVAIQVLGPPHTVLSVSSRFPEEKAYYASDVLSIGFTGSLLEGKNEESRPEKLPAARGRDRI